MELPQSEGGTIGSASAATNASIEQVWMWSFYVFNGRNFRKF